MPRFVLFVCACLCAVMTLASPAQAELYLRLTGSQQGPIEGDVVDGPLTGTIAIGSFQLGVARQIDLVTGLPVGEPFVSSLSMSKSKDGSTLSLLNALGTAEVMSLCTLEAWRPNEVGQDAPYLLLTLTNARIESLSISAAGTFRSSESLSLFFDDLTWRDLVTGEVYDYTMGPSSVQPSALGERFAVVTTPNPTSGDTRFDFRMPATGPVTIDVYDFRGRRVATVFDGEASTTEGVASWDGLDASGRPVASGVYLVKMRTGEWLTTHKMSVLR